MAVMVVLIRFMVVVFFVIIPILPIVILALLTGRGSRQRAATDDVGAGHRHGDVRQSSTGQGYIGKGDGTVGATRGDVSLERRSRHGHGIADPPKHVTRLAASVHDHRKVGARERGSSPD